MKVILGEEYELCSKPAVKKNKRERASGDQILGIRKDYKIDRRVVEWSFGLKARCVMENNKKITITTVYNNKGIIQIKEELENVLYSKK